MAVKLEHHSIDPSLLREEFEIYGSLAGGTGIPKVYWFGRECEYRAMVFEILGPSLEDLFNYCGRVFSLKMVLMLADQIITRLQHVHSKNVIHQDIKPEYFLMGIGEKGSCVYVTDLGLAAEFLPHDAPPAASESHFGLLGTANFASVNGHRGLSKRTQSYSLIAKLADHFPEQSQRDDMESLGYMMLYFLNGRLPWHGVRGESKQQKY